MKKYRRLLDPLNLLMYRSYRKRQENETLWDKLSNNIVTLGTIDSLILRRKKNETTIGDTIYWILMFPFVPAMDIYFWIIGPLIDLFGIFGQVKLPDLNKFQTPEPEDAFVTTSPSDIQTTRDKKYIEPALSSGDEKLSRQCDGHYLFIGGFSVRNMIFLLPAIAGVITFVWGGIDMVTHLGSYRFNGFMWLYWLTLGMILLLPLVIQWFPHRKGALFDRNRQLVTFFRGHFKRPITVPFKDIAFTAHLSGTGNLTKGLTLVCTRRLKNRRRPLSLQLVTGGGRNSDLHGEVSAIHAFMDRDNLGGFPDQLLDDIQQFRKHQLTLWRLCWKTPPPEAWAEYQQPDSLYQIELPKYKSNAWYIAQNPKRRAAHDKESKIARYVELYFTEQEHTEPELIQEVEEKWKGVAQSELFREFRLYDLALNELIENKKQEGIEESEALQELTFYIYKHLDPIAKNRDIKTLRRALNNFENKKLRLLHTGEITQSDYDFIDMKNYRPMYEERFQRKLEEKARQQEAERASASNS